MSPDRSQAAGPDEAPDDAGSDFAELGRVSAELLHDLGSTLTVLEGHVALARSEAALGRSVSPELSQIQRHAREMRQMVLDIVGELQGRGRSPDLAVAVAPLIEETVEQWVAAAPAVSASLDMSLPDDASIPGPRTFFTRTLANLLRNAGRHARSEVRIVVRAVGDGSTALEAVVEDDGEGVDASLGERIFEPLVAGAGGGSGLGLSFARWAAHRLGGTLELVPAPSLGGAAFRFRVPLSGADPERRSRPKPATFVGDRPLLGGMRIAVIDDEPAVVHVIRRRLEAEGAEVMIPAAPGDDALTSLLGELESWAPEVVLLDLNLGRRSGVTLHEAMERHSPDLARRVIFLTGDAPPEPPPGPPVVHKLVEWDEIVGRILAVSEDAERPRE